MPFTLVQKLIYDRLPNRIAHTHMNKEVKCWNEKSINIIRTNLTEKEK